MPLKHDLLEKGYLPENMPPAFSSGGIADFFATNHLRGFLSKGKHPVRPTVYNASKRGMTRRAFAVVHPVTGRDLSQFVTARWDDFAEFFAQSRFSLSTPKHVEESDRALQISSHSELETVRLARLSRYRFIATTDTSRFYHSVYTHSIPWAFHGKRAAKGDRKPQSATNFCNRADYILRCGQDGQTIGIPVGPDTSRVFAETVGTAIDLAFEQKCNIEDYTAVRHVDDVWIGTNSHADAEEALSRYREAIREFELDINESKTRIYEANFRFSDDWPTELALRFQFAIESPNQHVPERLRAACEHAFLLANTLGDDGVLKYAIRYIDRSNLGWEHWQTVEPFLKRAAVHYGHTVDYVSRVIVWRQLVHEDVDIEAWSAILTSILDKHGRLGNDSEVCWAIYACIRLNITIHHDIASKIVKNCGAMSVLALLNCIELDLVDRSVLDEAYEIVAIESATGPYWPILMEWIARRWRRHRQLSLDEDIVKEMAAQNTLLFNASRLPTVFEDLEEAEFESVSTAIERRISYYDDDIEEDEDSEWDERPF